MTGVSSQSGSFFAARRKDMTGIADLYLILRRPRSREAQARWRLLWESSKNNDEYQRFVVLAWRRTGSNLLCGILHHHPEIIMHNELFNQLDIFTYYPKVVDRWNVLSRDLYPEAFLQHIWSGQSNDQSVVNGAKAIGFKSFPDHWTDAANGDVFQKEIMDNFRVKKVILWREDELAAYLSNLRAERTGIYMTHKYPQGLRFQIQPARFQQFVDSYRDTYQRQYKSALKKRDSFFITYEQILDFESFERDILPLLWKFLGVSETFPMKLLRETVRQSEEDEDLSSVIENFDELEFCFRHTDVKHFALSCGRAVAPKSSRSSPEHERDHCNVMSWSILLPICSRGNLSKKAEEISQREAEKLFNANRLLHVAIESQHSVCETLDEKLCWDSLYEFAASLKSTSSEEQLSMTECIVGIDKDDRVFASDGARSRIKALLPCSVVFVTIKRPMYGAVCKIWNHLASSAKNDFLVLLGDDIVLFDKGWQDRVVASFRKIELRSGLPFGAGCVALNDLSFPGFPTFPVVHRRHIEWFGRVLPRQFVNQGGDPYLFELYSRFGAAEFEMGSRLRNRVGGDGSARYKKHEINWRGQILSLNLRCLEGHSGFPPSGLCLDVVVPSYRMNNNDILQKIMTLRASVHCYVRFWIVLDNPNADHIETVRLLADAINEKGWKCEGNYFVNVLWYGENRGASYARNFGYNYSTADWVLFLDDDVVPDKHILDAYLGALQRYPESKVFVGQTNLPLANNVWTVMLRTCNIMFFYGAASVFNHPPWGVTANLMVRGSRYNHTIQFRSLYPKTGGGEDMDFVFQFKRWYKKTAGIKTVVSVPGALALHPWWNQGRTCYRQINGWAWGDSLCITEWPEKTYLTLPNWIEFIVLFILPYSILRSTLSTGILLSWIVAVLEHAVLSAMYFQNTNQFAGLTVIQRVFIAFGASTIVTAQQLTRFVAAVSRCSFYSLCRRFDWNDGQDRRAVLDNQLRSVFQFALYASTTWWMFHQ